MPNAVEPPSESPTRLEAAYALLADATGRRGGRSPAARTSWSRSPARSASRPSACSTSGHSTSCAASSVEADALVIGALTTYTELRALAARRRVRAGAGRGGRHDRRGADPEPRHDRRKRRQRLARRRHAAGAAGARAPRSSSAPRPASERYAADEFWPAYRATARRRDELLVRIRIPLASDRQVRFRKIGTRRAQAISKVVMALAWRATARRQPRGPTCGWPSARWRRRRSVRAGAEAVLEGAAPDARDRRCGADRPRRPSSSRSTTSAPPPTTGAPSRAACCIGSSATQGRLVRRGRSDTCPSGTVSLLFTDIDGLDPAARASSATRTPRCWATTTASSTGPRRRTAARAVDAAGDGLFVSFPTARGGAARQHRCPASARRPRLARGRRCPGADGPAHR